MPTQHTFDGVTLEATLARVAEEIGPRARIKQAEKIRTGGVAGFFARERFEVTVELDDGPEAEESAVVTAAAPCEQPAAVSVLDLAEQVSDQELVTAQPSVDQWPAPDLAAAGGSAASAAHDLVTPRPSTEGRTFQEVLRGIASEAGLLQPATPSADTTIGASPAAGAGGLAISDLEPAPVDLMALGVPGTLLARADHPASPAHRLLSAFERLPQPYPLVAGPGEVVVVIGDEAVALEAAALAATLLGQSPVDVAVAGPRKRGVNSLSSPGAASNRVKQWRRCAVPRVVAVCTPTGPKGPGWNRQMLDALTPVAVWAAVRADRKADDIAAWVDHLGMVDALAVGACAETISPAAVLAAGIPVASLEGRRATPAAWTALLVERLPA